MGSREKICPKCGYQLTEQMKYCPKCGRAVEENECNTNTVEGPIDVNPTKAEHVANSPEPQDKTSKFQAWNEKLRHSKGYRIFVVVLIIVGLYSTIYKISQNSRKNQIVKVSNDTVIGCAETVVSKLLRAPSQARWYDTEVLDHDQYGRYLVHLDVDAMNGFGGYEKAGYLVIIYNVTKDGHFTYNTANGAFPLFNSNYTDTSIDNAKQLNDWGKSIENDSEP